MDDGRRARVQVFEHRQELQRDLAGVALAEAQPPVELLLQRLALDELLHQAEAQVHAAAVGEVAEHLWNARMIERGEDARLALEGIDLLRAWHAGEEQLLHRHRPARCVLGTVDARILVLRDHREAAMTARPPGRAAIVTDVLFAAGLAAERAARASFRVATHTPRRPRRPPEPAGSR